MSSDVIDVDPPVTNPYLFTVTFTYVVDSDDPTLATGT